MRRPGRFNKSDQYSLIDRQKDWNRIAGQTKRTDTSRQLNENEIYAWLLIFTNLD